MRSDLVFEAATRVSGRFLLTKLVSKTTRKLHKPNTRIQETTNAVFVRLSRANAIAGERCIQPLTGVPLCCVAETETLLHASDALPAEVNGVSF